MSRFCRLLGITALGLLAPPPTNAQTLFQQEWTNFCLASIPTYEQRCSQSTSTPISTCISNMLYDCGVSQYKSHTEKYDDTMLQRALDTYYQQLNPLLLRYVSQPLQVEIEPTRQNFATGAPDVSVLAQQTRATSNFEEPSPILPPVSIINADGSRSSYTPVNPAYVLYQQYQNTFNPNASYTPKDPNDRQPWNVFDWRNIFGRSYVNAVKDQKACGSCWAFASTSNFESQMAIFHNLFSVPNDTAPGIAATGAPTYGAVHKGGIDLPSDLSEQKVLEYTHDGDCTGGGSAINDVFANPVYGGIPLALEPYGPFCRNNTNPFQYDAATNGDSGFKGAWIPGATKGTPGTYCTACVLSNANGDGFKAFGYASGVSCTATNPPNQCQPTRNLLTTGMNFLSCRFMTKFAGDGYFTLFTTSVVKSGDPSTPGSDAVAGDKQNTPYNPVSQTQWSKWQNGVPFSQATIRSYLQSKGPLGIGIWAGSSSFQGYKSGVMDDVLCAVGINPSDTSKYGQDLGTNHVVNIVAYGTQLVNKCTKLKTTVINGKVVPLAECETSALLPTDYWVIKNSWGQSWGQGGYIKIESGKNICNLEKYLFTAPAPAWEETKSEDGHTTIVSSYDPCFNQRNVFKGTNGAPDSLFKQLQCYDWLCDGNAILPSLSAWNATTKKFNPPQSDPSYKPTGLNMDYKQTELTGQTDTGLHKTTLKNGFCDTHLTQFCSLGKSYCTEKTGSFGTNPEDSMRLLGDLFLVLLGQTPVGPVSSEQTCAYYRYKCLPHRFQWSLDYNDVTIVIDKIAPKPTTINPEVLKCVDQTITKLLPTPSPRTSTTPLQQLVTDTAMLSIVSPFQPTCASATTPQDEQVPQDAITIPDDIIRRAIASCTVQTSSTSFSTIRAAGSEISSDDTTASTMTSATTTSSSSSFPVTTLITIVVPIGSIIFALIAMMFAVYYRRKANQVQITSTSSSISQV